MVRFRIRTNWTNSVSLTHEFVLEDLAEPAARNMLKWAMSDPERLRPELTRQTLTANAAATFAELAQSLRDRGHEPEEIAHFVNRLVFCMFAEDAGLLPNDMFTKMLEQSRRSPTEFEDMAASLFAAMSSGGRVGFDSVPWFNGGLFDGEKAQWPEAQVVIGNPPFLGDRVMRGGLGHEYTERLRETYAGSDPASADLV